MAREQDGDRAGALADLNALLAGAPADAPWRGAVSARIARLEGRPPGAEAVAALPQGEQMAAIRAMVDQLAARLAESGGNAEQWARLVRARAVLGEPAAARRALADARAALAGDAAGLAQVNAVAREAGVEAAP